MRLCHVIAVLLLSLPSVHGLVINEIMYNPTTSQCNNDDCEWLEVYNDNDTEINLSGWFIDGDLIGNYTILPRAHMIITKTLAGPDSYESVWGNNDSVWNFLDGNYTAVEVSISLRNTNNDTINLTNNTESDEVFYLTSYANGNGKSLCRNISDFYECEPTPGRENIAVLNQSNVTNSTENCDIVASVSSDPMFFSGQTGHFNTILGGINCTESPAEYWIEDLFGSVAKPIEPVSHICGSKSRSWKPDNVDGSEAYVINFITYPLCNDTNPANNIASATIVVKGVAEQSESSIIIDKTEDVAFGEAATIELDVYRGNATKYLVDIYARNQAGSKVSYVSKIHAKLKYTSYRFSVPLQIKSNCNNDFADGNYTVVAEGLDKIAESSINIAGASSNCKTVTISSGGSGGGGIVSSNAISKYSVTYPETIFIGDEFDTIVRFNATSKKTYSFYSYVYKGNTPVSEGFDGTKWSGAWTANTREITTESDKTYVAVLRSRIEEETQPGVYNLRVKIKSDKEEEITKEIEVKEKPVKIPAVNESLNDTSIKQVSKISAAVTVIASKKSAAREILPLLSAILRVKKLF